MSVNLSDDSKRFLCNEWDRAFRTAAKLRENLAESFLYSWICCRTGRDNHSSESARGDRSVLCVRRAHSNEVRHSIQRLSVAELKNYPI